MINQDKPTTSFLNATKTPTGETWGSILTTWATETQTWGDTASFIDNTTKISSSISNISKPA
jgi:hypothetical protein